MDYMLISAVSKEWNLSARRIQILCNDGRICGAEKAGTIWLIPKTASKPKDARIKSGRYMRTK